jgi:hypothetical protein
MKRSKKDYSRMKTKNRPNTQETKRGFSAPSPQVLRTFSAGSPLINSGKGVEMVLRWCGNWGEYLLMVH